MSEICLSGRATTDRLGKANGNVNKRHELCMSANSSGRYIAEM